MKKLSLIATLLLAVLLFQKCKKDSYAESAMSNTLLFAVVDDTVWNAATVNTAITYNSATKTKVLTCTAIGGTQEVNMMVTQTTNALNTAGFPLNTNFNADAAGDNTFAYLVQQNSSFVQQGAVQPGSGTLEVTAIDSVKQLITGTFSMTSIRNNYDKNGNYLSTSVWQVTAGAFNNMPYTFKSQ